MTADFTITLEGDHGRISAESFRAALYAALQLLRDAGRALGLPAGVWNVEDLQVGSTTLALANPTAAGAAALVEEGLQTLALHPEIPRLWSGEMVRQARSLGRLAGSGGVRGVVVSASDRPPTRLDEALTLNAEQATQEREVSLATLRGRVDRWDERSGHALGLTLEDRSTLTASYPSRLAARVRREAIGERIEVWGELRRNAAGQRVTLAVENFAVLPLEVPMGVDAIAGLYRDLGDAGVTTADVLRHRE